MWQASLGTQNGRYEFLLNASIKEFVNIENIFGKDISELSQEELVKYFSDSDCLTYNALRDHLKYINSYRKYCTITARKPWNAKMAVEARLVPLAPAYKKNLFFSTSEFSPALVNYTIEGGYFTPLLMCLSWNGLRREDILDLPPQNLYYDDQNVLHLLYNDVETVIDDAYCEKYLGYYITHKSFVRAKYGVRSEFYKTDMNKFVSSYREEKSKRKIRPLTDKYFNSCLSGEAVMLEKIKKPLTPRNVKLSGCFAKAYAMEQDGQSIPDSYWGYWYSMKRTTDYDDIIEEYKQYKIARAE